MIFDDETTNIYKEVIQDPYALKVIEYLEYDARICRAIQQAQIRIFVDEAEFHERNKMLAWLFGCYSVIVTLVLVGLILVMFS